MSLNYKLCFLCSTHFRRGLLVFISHETAGFWTQSDAIAILSIRLKLSLVCFVPFIVRNFFGTKSKLCMLGFLHVPPRDRS